MLGFNLKSLWESQGPEQCLDLLQENLASGEFKPEDFSLRELAESFCGYDWVRRLNPRNLARGRVNVMEAGEAVDVSAFSNITGQIMFTKIMDGWKQAVANSERLVETVSTQFDGEKIPWLGNLPEEGQGVIRPLQPYPETQFGERYIETPATDKRGIIVSISKEMIFFDRTSQALKIGGQVGERFGFGKSKRIWDAALGITNNYKLNGSSFNTYLTSGGWINKKSGTPLVDWTSIEQVYILAANILDPDTGNPIDFELKQLIPMPGKLFTAKRIQSATEVRTTFPGYQASVNAPGNVAMTTGNPLPESFEIVYSKLAYQRLLANGVNATAAQDYWFIGDFPRAIKYMENWPLTVVQAPPNNIKEFEQDIVWRSKVSERGVVSVQEPRCVFWFYNA